MSSKKPKPLKPNWFHILVSLADRDRHGYAIMQEVAERTSNQVRLWPATLYGSIRSLTQEGLIEERPSHKGEDDDPRRRYYHLTRRGRHVLGAEADRLQRLVEMVRAKGIRSSEST